MDTPWLTGGPQAPAACAGDIPLGVDGLSLGCWVCWVWSWSRGWELSATVWAHPLLPWAPARAWGGSPAGGWDRERAGGTGGDCTAVFFLHLPQKCS